MSIFSLETMNSCSMRVFNVFDALMSGKSRNVVIWLNGSTMPNSKLRNIWNSALLRACTDGAANQIHSFIIDNGRAELRVPDIVAGDMDSISRDANEYFSSIRNPSCSMLYTPDQDRTDLSKCLDAVVDIIDKQHLQVDHMITLGGLSGRFDHTMGVLNSMVRMCEKSAIPVLAVESKNLVTVLHEGSTRIHIDRKECITGTCGLVPLVQRSTRVSTTGLHWNLDNIELGFGRLLSTSNQLDASTIEVRTNAPLLLTLELSDRWLSLQ